MAFNITRGIQIKPIKCIIYGPAGIGKSSFASRFPDPLFIDTEDSTVNMDVKRFDRPNDWNMLLGQVKEVKNNPSLCCTLVIDTADWAERLCEDNIIKKNGKTSIEDFGYGKGYVLVKEEFGRFLDLLSEITERGINIVLTAHSIIRKIELPDEAGAYDRYELKLGGKSGNACAALAKEWSDLLLFANYKTEVTEINGKKKAQGGRRVMYTEHNPCWDAKNRFGLKSILPFDFDELVKIESMAHCFKNVQKCPAAEKLEQGNKEEQPTPPPTEKNVENNIANDPLSEGVDKRLIDLCNADKVTLTELTAALKSMGIMPDGAELKDAPPDLVSEMVAHWQEILQEISVLVPFK